MENLLKRILRAINTTNVYAQTIHFLLAFSIVLTFAYLSTPVAAAFSGIAVTGLAAGKEFYIDAKYEDPATRGSDLEDFSFYFIGACSAGAVVLLRMK